MFSCEFCEILKNSCFQRTLPLAASDKHLFLEKLHSDSGPFIRYGDISITTFKALNIHLDVQGKLALYLIVFAFFVG